MKRIIPINTTDDGLCRTIRANYYKMNASNFLSHKNNGLGAVPAVMEIIEYEETNEDNDTKKSERKERC